MITKKTHQGRCPCLVVMCHGWGVPASLSLCVVAGGPCFIVVVSWLGASLLHHCASCVMAGCPHPFIVAHNGGQLPLLHHCASWLGSKADHKCTRELPGSRVLT